MKKKAFSFVALSLPKPGNTTTFFLVSSSFTPAAKPEIIFLDVSKSVPFAFEYSWASLSSEPCLSLNESLL